MASPSVAGVPNKGETVLLLAWGVASVAGWLDMGVLACSSLILDFFSARSVCPRSRLGSMMLRTRFLSSFVSGKPPSALRSQTRCSVTFGRGR